MTESAGRLTVAAIQMSMSESAEQNFDQAAEQIIAAAGQGARLVCLPELFQSRYFCQNEDTRAFSLAEPVPGPTTKKLEHLAKELDVVVVAGMFERRAAGVFHNTAIVLDGRNGYMGMYRKMHIPDDPRYYEKFYFAPGDLGFRSFATRAGNIGVLICWDQWYPEAARLTAMAGAQVLIYPTAIGWHPEEKASTGQQQFDAWQTIQRAHAIANGSYVVSINRCGFEPGPGGGGIEFWGRSFVAGPGGELLAQATEDAQQVIVDIDIGQVEQSRVDWPFFRDRRIDAYSDITRRFIDAE